MNKQHEDKLRSLLRQIFDVKGQDQYEVLKIVKEEYLRQDIIQ